ncbi:MAG: NADPH-dependent oxidoreductase [Armatimonadetes bacterium]|nr:NADPH-dependent oxidoreductase [Armatimonadota bacterium]
MDETKGEAWSARYGQQGPEADGVPDAFFRHRSVRRYSDRAVPESVVVSLIGAAQSASTSSNLQLWSVVSVQEPDRREAVARLCDDQEHVRRAPWFFAFFADHHRLRSAAVRVGERCSALDTTEFLTMAVIDAALAAERMACAAESMGLGLCYIGALRNDAAAVKDLFGLPEGVFGVFGMTLGWPVEGLQAKVKPRLAQSAVWFRETYSADIDVSEYDERMRAFYVLEGMKGEVTWSMRSGRRADDSKLTGRDRLKAFLDGQGMDRR